MVASLATGAAGATGCCLVALLAVEEMFSTGWPGYFFASLVKRRSRLFGFLMWLIRAYSINPFSYLELDFLKAAANSLSEAAQRARIARL